MDQTGTIKRKSDKQIELLRKAIRAEIDGVDASVAWQAFQNYTLSNMKVRHQDEPLAGAINKDKDEDRSSEHERGKD